MGKVESITGLSFPCETRPTRTQEIRLAPHRRAQDRGFLKKTGLRSTEISARGGAARDDSPAPARTFTLSPHVSWPTWSTTTSQPCFPI